MKNERNNIFLQKKATFGVCCILIVICGLIGGLGGFGKIDNTVYDLLLRIIPEPPVSQEVLFVDIDDQSLDIMGTWPWSRDILADALIRMKELGAEYAVFDIEYLTRSQDGINPDMADEIPLLIAAGQSTVVSVMESLAAAAAAGQFDAEYLPEINAGVLETDILPAFSELQQAVENISRDNDDYFGRAVQFFGNTWLTVNYADIITTSDAVKEYTKERFLFNSVTDTANRIYKTNRNTIRDQQIMEGFSPTYEPILKRAAGAGFTNVIIDGDGSRRRVELLYNKDGKYLGQLVFAPLLDKLDTRELVRTTDSLVIKNALLPGNSVREDITIPLDSDGYMLINWMHGDFTDSFRHTPVVALVYLDDYEKQIAACINWLYNDCYLLAADGSWLDYYTGSRELAGQYAVLTAQKQFLLEKCNGFDTDNDPLDGIISAEEYNAYFTARQDFFDSCRTFAAGTSFAQIENRLEELAAEGVPAEEITAFHSAVSETYQLLESALSAYTESFNFLSQEYAGAFCIIGNSATGTTDMGTTPFIARYPNVGTHGNVYNTIVTKSFIRPVSWLYLFAAVSLLLLVFSWFTRNLKQSVQVIAGGIGVCAVPVFAICIMRFGLVYIPVSASLTVVLLGYAADVAFRFFYAEHDKRFLRQAFSTYLSKDVVDDIVTHPEKLALGGTEKNITALFSDIKSFSTLSEKVSPVQLVSILNGYLTTMSDLILEEQGTIDKYIGDAIVAFFGAPGEVPDHAFRACAAAVRMKQAEKRFNETQTADGTIPMPVLTRIGINTGKMVVGNMGTDRKMNYTIMGNNVNIAARLEGVNKVYASWVLVSESTWREADSGTHAGVLVARRLDRVRVVGINEPVQLYNIMGFAAEMSREEKLSVDTFHDGLEKYLNRRFAEAEDLFKKAADLNPEDGAPGVFIERCRKFIAEPPAAGWDGVMTMATK